MRIFERYQFYTCLLWKMLQPSCTELETLKLNVTTVLCIMLQIKTLANLIFVPLKFQKKIFHTLQFANTQGYKRKPVHFLQNL